MLHTAALLAVAALGGEVESARFEMRGYVPVICRVEQQGTGILNNGIDDLGSVDQFCNNGLGYTFVIQHDASFDGVFLFGDKRIEASDSGTTVLETTSYPVFRSVPLRVENAGSQPLSLSLMMVPNG